jgi:hypothetical protein
MRDLLLSRPTFSPAQRQNRRHGKKPFLCAAFDLGYARRWSCLGNGWLGRVVIEGSGEGRPRLGQALPQMGGACRRPQAAGGDWSAARANVQAATLRLDCRSESGSFSETSEKGVLEQPNRDRNGEGVADHSVQYPHACQLPGLRSGASSGVPPMLFTTAPSRSGVTGLSSPATNCLGWLRRTPAASFALVGVEPQDIGLAGGQGKAEG